VFCSFLVSISASRLGVSTPTNTHSKPARHRSASKSGCVATLADVSAPKPNR